MVKLLSGQGVQERCCDAVRDPALISPVVRRGRGANGRGIEGKGSGHIYQVKQLSWRREAQLTLPQHFSELDSAQHRPSTSSHLLWRAPGPAAATATGPAILPLLGCLIDFVPFGFGSRRCPFLVTELFPVYCLSLLTRGEGYTLIMDQTENQALRTEQ